MNDIKTAKKLLKKAGFVIIYEPTDSYEMTPLRKIYTGLPMNIWIDELQKYKIGKHEIYVKFQQNTDIELNYFKKVGAINLNGEIKHIDKASELTDTDIEKLRNYISNNREAIEKVAECELFLRSIEKYLIKGGKIATKEEKERLLKEIEKLIKKEEINE